MNQPLPQLDYSKWVDTKDTIHLFLQIIGKVRLKTHPKLNHWWHVTLYPSPRGLSTGRIPYSQGGFEILYDMLDHCVTISGMQGRQLTFSVHDCSVAKFYNDIFEALSALKISVDINTMPYENKSKIPFPLDDQPRAYDKAAVTRFWQALCSVASVMEIYRGRFNGKQTPVQLYWHSFDLVVTRFSGKAYPLTGGTQSDKEAYSHEVISVGFWPGDETFKEAAFYGYAYPEPRELNTAPLKPAPARWVEKNGGALAVLTYEDWRSEHDTRASLLQFFDSIYQEAGTKSGWTLDDFEHQFA